MKNEMPAPPRSATFVTFAWRATDNSKEHHLSTLAATESTPSPRLHILKSDMWRLLYTVLISAALISAKDVGKQAVEREHLEVSGSRDTVKDLSVGRKNVRTLMGVDESPGALSDEEEATPSVNDNIFHDDEEEIPDSSFLDIFTHYYKPKNVVIKRQWPWPTDSDPPVTTPTPTPDVSRNRDATFFVVINVPVKLQGQRERVTLQEKRVLAESFLNTYESLNERDGAVLENVTILEDVDESASDPCSRRSLQNNENVTTYIYESKVKVKRGPQCKNCNDNDRLFPGDTVDQRMQEIRSRFLREANFHRAATEEEESCIGCPTKEQFLVEYNKAIVELQTGGSLENVTAATEIDGEAAGDLSGWSVSASSDGSTLAVGSPLNNDNGLYSGHVRVYRWNESKWAQLGCDIDGEKEYSFSGVSVSLSSDGGTLAVGAPGNNDNGYNSGHVRVYNWNGNTWDQLGSDIDGEAAYDEFGGSVSLSSDGRTLAVGAPDNNSDNGFDSGHVRVYTWAGTAWLQLGSDIDGEAAYDEFGWSVSLSSDGRTLAIGAPLNDGSDFDSDTSSSPTISSVTPSLSPWPSPTPTPSQSTGPISTLPSAPPAPSKPETVESEVPTSSPAPSEADVVAESAVPTTISSDGRALVAGAPVNAGIVFDSETTTSTPTTVSAAISSVVPSLSPWPTATPGPSQSAGPISTLPSRSPVPSEIEVTESEVPSSSPAPSEAEVVESEVPSSAPTILGPAVAAPIVMAPGTSGTWYEVFSLCIISTLTFAFSTRCSI